MAGPYISAVPVGTKPPVAGWHFGNAMAHNYNHPRYSWVQVIDLQIMHLYLKKNDSSSISRNSVIDL